MALAGAIAFGVVVPTGVGLYCVAKSINGVANSIHEVVNSINKVDNSLSNRFDTSIVGTRIESNDKAATTKENSTERVESIEG